MIFAQLQLSPLSAILLSRAPCAPQASFTRLLAAWLLSHPSTPASTLPPSSSPQPLQWLYTGLTRAPLLQPSPKPQTAQFLTPCTCPPAHSSHPPLEFKLLAITFPHPTRLRSISSQARIAVEPARGGQRATFTITFWPPTRQRYEDTIPCNDRHGDKVSKHHTKS